MTPFMKSALSLLAASLLAAPTVADDTRGKDRLLCTAETLTVCIDTGECAAGDEDELNIPHFFIVNLSENQLETTQASGEDRQTPIRAVSRADDLLILQGSQNQRAFSIVITEPTGIMSLSAAADGFVASVFGSCTPLD